ncbi:unnamed protein product [Paramecium primaurelia]|uniref:non-specific serine/threonine protein kinase n=1 Tax=Paramecium primaurelia TaxID=5886 RepID=A0A8S1L392_PARPR|nr:unnamed protein product [Paramecium primaurelia]
MISYFLFFPFQIFAFTQQQSQQLISNDVNLYLDINSGNIFDYAFKKKIGEGSFSDVYLGYRVEDQVPVVLKHIKDSYENVVNREIQILRTLQGLPNIVQIIDAIKVNQSSNGYYDQVINQMIPQMETKNQSNQQKNYVATIIFSYQNTTRSLDDIFRKGKYSLNLVKNYFKQIFIALSKAHELHIMHRDIKSENILVDKNDNILVIDWGLGQFYNQGKSQSTRMGTLYYKAPELLLKYKKYDYSIDIWAVGCMLADFIFKTDPLFSGKDEKDQLRKIISMLGTNDLFEYLKKYHIKFVQNDIPQVQDRINFTKLVNKKNKKFVTNEGIDLLDKIFVYDHKLRINASQALEHAFFL